MLDGLFFGTATQGEAARRGRPRGAVREQEDEDAQGHDDGLRRRAAAPAELRAAVCSALAEQALIGDRAGLRRLNPRDRPATACGEGCERLNGFAPPRPLEAPSLVAQRKGLPPDKRPRSRTRREDRVRAVQRSPRVPAEARSGASQHYYG